MRLPAAPGAVLVRSADPEVRLQGLRTALSLAMGDRPAVLYLVGDGRRVLDEPDGSEVKQCLSALPDAGVQVSVEPEMEKLVDALAGAEFQQTF